MPEFVSTPVPPQFSETVVKLLNLKVSQFPHVSSGYNRNPFYLIYKNYKINYVKHTEWFLELKIT